MSLSMTDAELGFPHETPGVRSSVSVLLLGTEAGVGKGGISSIIGQHLETVRRVESVECARHFVTHKAGLLGKILPAIQCIPRILRAAARAPGKGARLVVMAHPGSGFCLLRTAALALVSQMAGAKVAWFFHTPYLHKYLEQRRWRYFFAFVANRFDELCFLTRHGQSTFVAAFPDSARKSSVIGNPLPPNSAGIDEACVLDAADPRGVILCMSRLVDGKGVDKVIAALPLLPEYRLRIAGEGEQESLLRSMVSDLGIADRVEFLGWVSGADKERLWRECTLFCLPSRCDSFGMSFAEALVRGVPVVALEWAGVPEVVSSRWNVLISDDSADSVAKGVRKVGAIASEPSHRVLRRREFLVAFSDDRIEASYAALIRRARL